MRRCWLAEKLGVQGIAAMAAVAVYWLIAPRLTGSDPFLPAAFVPDERWGQAVGVAATFWVLAAMCGALLVVARPEGALAAALVGLAGISAFSPPIRSLLWSSDGTLRSVYLAMLVEVLLGGAALIVAAEIVGMVHRAVMPLVGRLGWRPIEQRVPDIVPESVAPDEATIASLPGRQFGLTVAILLWGLRSLLRRGKGDEPVGTDKLSGPGRRAACMAMTLILGIVLVALLMQSADRKQVIFAVSISFLVASLVAHQTFPTACSMLVWITPVLVGAGVYALAAVTAGSTGAGAMDWLETPLLARALPIDWIAAGSGGAMLGVWISGRSHETKLVEACLQKS
ncbi:MAG: hypothetical protein ACYS8X_01055 [Planctomycetota bacterium]